MRTYQRSGIALLMASAATQKFAGTGSIAIDLCGPTVKNNTRTRNFSRDISRCAVLLRWEHYYFSSGELIDTGIKVLHLEPCYSFDARST